MGKLYTLDGKLLTETPEIRVGEKIYPVDNRKKTVTKILDAATSASKNTSADVIDRCLELALGKPAAKELNEMDLPFPAYMQLFTLVISAATGFTHSVFSGIWPRCSFTATMGSSARPPGLRP